VVYLVGLTRGSAMVRGHLGFNERILNKINKNGWLIFRENYFESFKVPK